MAEIERAASSEYLAGLEERRKRENRRNRAADAADKTFRIVLYVFTCVYCLTLLVPIYWLVLNSFKDPFEYYLNPTFSFPKKMLFSNFEYFLTNVEEVRYTATGRITYGLPEMFMYSVLWAAVPPAISLFWTFMCAYILARFRFRGGRFIYNLGTVIMIIPIMGMGGEDIILKRALGMYDNMFLTMIVNGGTFYGLNFLILYTMCKTIPKEYEEAVFIDGGGHFRALLTVLPMMLPTVAVMWVMSFITGWNDYSTFLTYLPSYANIALGMYNFQYNARMQDGVSQPQVLAGLILVCIPSVLLYLVNQKAITSKFYVGGIKG